MGGIMKEKKGEEKGWGLYFMVDGVGDDEESIK